jgi:hypothetical protein
VGVFPIAGRNEITGHTAVIITAAIITAAAPDCANCYYDAHHNGME